LSGIQSRFGPGALLTSELGRCAVYQLVRVWCPKLVIGPH
jgi:hypothetical protein